MNGRAWNAAELKILRRLVAQGKPPVEIVAVLRGRSLRSVYQRRAMLGLDRQVKRLLGSLNAFITERAALEQSDREIAAAWNAQQSDIRARIDRRCITERRRKLGLPRFRDSERYRRQVAQRTRAQLDQSGVGSLAELEKQVIRRRIVAMGWPPDLTWREAQICPACGGRVNSREGLKTPKECKVIR